MACQEIAYRSDSLVELRDLKDEAGAAVTSATVTAQLYDEDGTALGSAISMPHVANGLYRGIVPDALIASPGVVPGKLLKIVVTADAGADKHLERTLRVIVGSAS